MNLKKAILSSLSYRAVFKYPLSFYQLSTFLFKNQDEHDNNYNLPEFEKTLSALKREEKISSKNGKYFLIGHSYVDWYERYQNSKELIEKGQKIADILKKIPWIKFIGITGAVSAFGAGKDDDIDFIIITEQNRLWLVRGFVFVILKILGELRTDKNPQRKICPNIFLAEDFLFWNNRNRYVAFETVSIHPLYDKDNTYFKFMRENDWVFDYFADFNFNFKNTGSYKDDSNILMQGLEKMAFILQKKYMESKRTTELIEENRIHFNRQDHSNRILEEHKQIKNLVL